MPILVYRREFLSLPAENEQGIMCVHKRKKPFTYITSFMKRAESERKREIVLYIAVNNWSQKALAAPGQRNEK